MAAKPLVNPHLAGGPFFFEGGPDGVLLVHGLTATTAEVRPLAEDLHAAGYTVSGPLLPGHGTQPEDLNHVRWQDWLQTVEESYCAAQGALRAGGGWRRVDRRRADLHLAATHPEIAAVLSYAPALKLTVAPDPGDDRVRAGAVRRDDSSRNPARPASRTRSGRAMTCGPARGIRELLRLQASRAAAAARASASRSSSCRAGSTARSTRARPRKSTTGSVRQIKELLWLDRSAHCVALDCERARTLRDHAPVPAQHLRAFTSYCLRADHAIWLHRKNPARRPDARLHHDPGARRRDVSDVSGRQGACGLPASSPSCPRTSIRSGPTTC